MGAPARTGRASAGGSRWSGAGRIDDVGDVARVLRAVNDRIGRRESMAGVPAPAVTRADNAAVTAVDVLPVATEIADVLPWRGLRRGATVAVLGSSSLLLTLLAGGMRNGGWAAVVGLPALSPIAADEYGVDLARLALIPDPGPEWTTVVGSLVDGLDLVVVNTLGPVAERTARVLMGRARQRGAVLLTTRDWPGADLTLRVTETAWTGLGNGRGRLRGHTVDITVHGRGSAARPRTTRLALRPLEDAGAGAGVGAPAPSTPERVSPVSGAIAAEPAFQQTGRLRVG